MPKTVLCKGSKMIEWQRNATQQAAGQAQLNLCDAGFPQ